MYDGDWLAPIGPNILGLWPQFRSPLIWDVFAVSTYLTVSLLFWLVGLIPDFAIMRDPRSFWMAAIFPARFIRSHRDSISGMKAKIRKISQKILAMESTRQQWCPRPDLNQHALAGNRF